MKATATPRTGAGHDLAAIRRALGEDPAQGRSVTLLAVPRGEKGPRVSGWQHTTYTETRDPAYEAKLKAANIGVLLHGGLCAIDLDDDEELTPFLRANPTLRDTLIVRGARGAKVFLRCQPDREFLRRGWPSYPPFLGLDFTTKTQPLDATKPNAAPRPVHWGEWLAEHAGDSPASLGAGRNAIVAGRHPAGHDYTWLSPGPVVTIPFRDIVWPPHVTQPWHVLWHQWTVHRYGQPWTANAEGAPQSMQAHYWAARYGLHHDVVYEANEERFYEYEGRRGLWHRRSEEELCAQLSLDMLAASRQLAAPVLETNRFRGLPRLREVVNLAQGEFTVRDCFAIEPGIVHVANGMLDLRTSPATLRPFGPDYLSRNQVPIDYRAGATCPCFERELLAAALPIEDIDLLQRWMGQCLLGKNMAQVIFILTGTAGGGKSTLVNVLRAMVGDANCAQLRTAQLEERFELMAYVGKTLLSAPDVPGNFLMRRGSHVLKQLSGGDALQAEKKGGEFYNLRGDFNIIMTCNSRLRVSLDADADAWRRRLRIIRYDRPKPEKAMDDFAGFLVRTEGPGILNWMLEGARKLLDERAQHGTVRLRQTAAQAARVDDLLEESESLKTYVRKCIVQSPGQDITTEEIITSYLGYCDARGWTAVSKGEAEKALPDLMLELHRATRRNDVKREGTARKGYGGFTALELRDPS